MYYENIRPWTQASYPNECDPSGQATKPRKFNRDTLRQAAGLVCNLETLEERPECVRSQTSVSTSSFFACNLARTDD